MSDYAEHFFVKNRCQVFEFKMYSQRTYKSPHSHKK